MNGEERLSGGSSTGAVRVGDTVRKPSGPWTPAVHALLTHLEAVGFDRAPRSLGVDDRGRHITSYLPGDTVGDGEVMPWPAWCWTEGTLIDVATWLHGYHDALTGFVPPSDATWRSSDRTAPSSFICHNDPGPYNLVWDGRVVGFVDWDLAGPGDPRMDVAHVCLDFAPLLSPAFAAPLGAPTGLDDQLGRARLVLDTYGIEDRSPFPDLIVELFRSKVRRARSATGTDPVPAIPWDEDDAFSVDTLAYVESIRDRLEEAFE